MTKECCATNQHPSHKKEHPRLNRIAGQLEGVKKMIDERRYCPDILTQLKALRSALKSVETSMLETHLSHCVQEAMQSNNEQATREKIEELTQIFKRFED